jgi:hypothetical protein
MVVVGKIIANNRALALLGHSDKAARLRSEKGHILGYH